MVVASPLLATVTNAARGRKLHFCLFVVFFPFLPQRQMDRTPPLQLKAAGGAGGDVTTKHETPKIGLSLVVEQMAFSLITSKYECSQMWRATLLAPLSVDTLNREKVLRLPSLFSVMPCCVENCVSCLAIVSGKAIQARQLPELLHTAYIAER